MTIAPMLALLERLAVKQRPGAPAVDLAEDRRPQTDGGLLLSPLLLRRCPSYGARQLRLFAGGHYAPHDRAVEPILAFYSAAILIAQPQRERRQAAFFAEILLAGCDRQH